MNRSCSRENELVVKSNSLVDASYGLSIVEFRVLQLVISEISKYEDSSGVLSGGDFIVTIDQYIQTFGVDRSTAYEALKDAGKRLFNRYFTYERIYKLPHCIEVVEARWVQRIGYSKQGGFISLALSQDVLDLVGKLKEQFVRYQIKEIAPLSSIYAVRIYEMILKWIGLKKTPLIALNVLRERLGVLETEYLRTYDFKVNVLDVGIAQINKNTNISVKYIQHKTGRSITGFHFEMRYKKGKEPSPPTKKIRATISKSEAEKLAKTGESWEELYKRLSSDYFIKY